MPSTSMPRAAISVATSVRTLPVRNAASTRSRWFCDLLPWIASAAICDFWSERTTLSAPCLVRVNTSTRSIGSLRRSLRQQRGLRRAVDQDHALVNAIDGGRGRRHRDPDRVLQHGIGKLGDLARHGRGEEQGLTLGRQFRHDTADVVDEAHVEHAVGFVEHEDLDAVEVHGAVRHQVEQPAGRRHQHVDAMGERPHLRVDVDAADRERHRRAQVAAVGLEAVDDLRRELARRREHQHAAALRQRLVAVVGEVIEDRQREGGGLAGSGLRDADDVAALHHLRDGLCLDRRGSGVLLVGEGFGDWLGEAEVEKSSQLQIFRMAISAAAADVGFTRYRKGRRGRHRGGYWTSRVSGLSMKGLDAKGRKPRRGIRSRDP